jgi:hypothetical protein
MTIDTTLAERGERYSPNGFIEVARMSQNLKRTMRSAPNWASLPADARESLEMIQLKISRMIIGDPGYEDNVIDIIGYATLMQKGIQERNQKHGIQAQVEKPSQD